MSYSTLNNDTYHHDLYHINKKRRNQSLGEMNLQIIKKRKLLIGKKIGIEFNKYVCLYGGISNNRSNWNNYMTIDENYIFKNTHMGSSFYHIIDWLARPSLYVDINISKLINIQNCIQKRPIKVDSSIEQIDNDIKSGREIITKATELGYYDNDEYNYLISSYPLNNEQLNNDLQRAIYLRRLKLYNLNKYKIYNHSQQIMASKEFKDNKSSSFLNSISNALADEPDFYDSIFNPPPNYMPSLASLIQLN